MAMSGRKTRTRDVETLKERVASNLNYLDDHQVDGAVWAGIDGMVEAVAGYVADVIERQDDQWTEDPEAPVEEEDGGAL